MVEWGGGGCIEDVVCLILEHPGLMGVVAERSAFSVLGKGIPRRIEVWVMSYEGEFVFTRSALEIQHIDSFFVYLGLSHYPVS